MHYVHNLHSNRELPESLSREVHYKQRMCTADVHRSNPEYVGFVHVMHMVHIATQLRHTMRLNITSITERALDALRIPEVWNLLQLPGKPAQSCRSPFRPDRNPSFSVYRDGRYWKDHATNEGGDAIAFYATAHEGMSRKEAWKAFCILAGTLEPNGQPAIPRSLKPRPAAPALVERLPDLTRTQYPSAAEIGSIARLRHLSIEGVRLTAEMGCLRMGRVHAHAVWIVTDASQRVATARRLDGQLFTYENGSTSKSHALSSKSMPVGLHGLGTPRIGHAVMFCEGEGDFLAAYHFIAMSGAHNLHPVAMLGRTQTLSPEACNALQGWRIRFYPHVDPDGGGTKAAERWASNIPDAKCDLFNFEGILMENGSMVSDLNECAAGNPSIYFTLLPILSLPSA